MCNNQYNRSLIFRRYLIFIQAYSYGMMGMTKQLRNSSHFPSNAMVCSLPSLLSVVLSLEVHPPPRAARVLDQFIPWQQPRPGQLGESTLPVGRMIRELRCLIVAVSLLVFVIGEARDRRASGRRSVGRLIRSRSVGTYRSDGAP